MSQPKGEPATAFGRYVKAAIKSAGFRSPSAFAREAGMDPSVVLRWISGKAHPSAATLTKVAPLLNVREAELIAVAYPSAEIVEGDPNQLPPFLPPDPSWLSTPEGIARHLHRDDLPLVALLHRAGLTESDLFRLILKVRARREQQNAELLEEVAAAIRDLGGWAPERPYPPLWLVEE